MKKLRITVGNKSYDVTVEDLTEADSYQISSTTSPPTPPAAGTARPVQPAAQPKPRPSLEAGAVTSPMAGAIKSILVKPGDQVKQGQPLVVLEAMKMDNQITAPVAGTVASVDVSEGQSVAEGHVLVVLE